MEYNDEEDDEIILKNSELYNYLLNCKSGDFECYDKNIPIKGKLPVTEFRKAVTKVPTEYLTNLRTILNSNILLDEDITYLYGHTVELINDLKTKKYRDVLVSSALGFCSFIFAIRYNALIQLDHILKYSVNAKYYFNQWQRTQSLLRLIKTVKKSNLFIKKTFRILHEENAYFKLQQLKSKTNGKTEECDFLEKKKKAEIDTLSAVLCQCLINNIQTTREATHVLIYKLPLIRLVDSKDQYLAFMSDDNLGLTAYSNPSCNTSVSSNLETLRNMYLLMQSEFFRRLGLCFCPTLWPNEVPLNLLLAFEVIEKYSNSCEEVSSIIKFYYERHILPDVVENRKPTDSTFIGGYSAMHKINTSLAHLVMDSRALEEYVESLKGFDKLDANLLCSKLEELRQGLDICAENILCAEKYFSKLRRDNKLLIEGDKKELLEEKVNAVDKIVSTDFEVGKTSQNVDSKDRVYFAITEGKIVREESAENNDLEPVKFPTFLMTELKEALVEKKNEFNVRENKAVENSEEYKKFLSAPETDPEKPEEKRVQEFPDLNCSTLQMHKILASAVAQRSGNFVKHTEEEQFGSSSESDSEF